jgi:hypothetical protein
MTPQGHAAITFLYYQAIGSFHNFKSQLPHVAQQPLEYEKS